MSDDDEVLAVAARRVGTVLHGKYHLDRVIGVGGMATVYAATHRNRKQFAVKMLHPEFSVRRDVRTRFVREGYVANSVNHPGVVTVLDDDVDEAGAAFIVMELLEGITVEALYAPAGTPVPLRETLEVGCQLLDVLEAAHERAIVHRDVKPANLFLLKDGRLKVLDFGIARLRDADAGLKSTRTGATLGTPAFMAPEQALATPAEIDARTDIWAAGATLFTMLTAQFVHEGENARQIMIRAATVPARSLAALAPDLPTSVVEIVSRALMFDKAERWPSAASMREALLAAQRELFGEPTASHLGVLVQHTSASISSSPTEPADGSGRLQGTPRELDASLGPALGSISTPVSTDSSGEHRGGARFRKFGLISAVGALLGTGLLVALLRRPVEHPPSAAAPPPEAAVATQTAVEPASTPVSVASSAPAPVASSTVTVPEPKPMTLTTKPSGVAPRASAGPRTPIAPPTPTRHPTPANSAPAPAPRANPLQLELQ